MGKYNRRAVETRTGNFVDGTLREVFETNAGMLDGMYEVQIIWNDQMIVRPADYQ